MKTWRVWVCVASIAVNAPACGDDSSGDGGSGGSAASSTSASTTSSVNSTTGSSNAAPLAPVLDMVEPMHGALHLYWTNTTPDCDTVTGERSEDGGMFTQFFSVPGTVDNEADDAATDAMITYSYRVRCAKAGQQSPYSNEVSASPMP